jgi:hypothetical protein
MVALPVGIRRMLRPRKAGWLVRSQSDASNFSDVAGRRHRPRQEGFGGLLYSAAALASVAAFPVVTTTLMASSTRSRAYRSAVGKSASAKVWV